MTHPLTDEILEAIHEDYLSLKIEFDEALRAAADWQLEQVIEWLKVNLMKHNNLGGYEYLYLDCLDSEIEVDLVIKDLKKTMRPQEES